MSFLKITHLFGMLAVFLLSGCSSPPSGQVQSTLPPAPPLAPQPEPEPADEPEPEPVEVVVVEPEEPMIKEEPEPAQVEPPAAKPPKSNIITVLGLIKYVELEGGFFGIVAEDGKKYFPDYLGQDFKVDGLSVRVQAQPQEQMLGIQMWGNPIKILRIEAH